MCGLGRGNVSHSITSGIRTIQQEDVAQSRSNAGGGHKKSSLLGGVGGIEEWEIIGKEEKWVMGVCVCVGK